MLYFCNKVRVETVEECRVLAAWDVLFNVFVKRCTSSDLENKSLLKARATQMPGRENSKSLGVARTSD